MVRSADNIGKNLKVIMADRKVSQVEIKRATGISPQTICKCIKGVQNINCTTLIILAEFFNVPTDYFFEDNNI